MEKIRLNQRGDRMFGWITGMVEQTGYAGIAVLMLLENMFPPIPSELIMPVSGFTGASSHLNIEFE